MKIYKYTLYLYPYAGLNTPVPMQGKLLDIQVQDGVTVVWAEHDSTIPPITTIIRALMTGETAPLDQHEFTYFKTLQVNELVLHFYTKC